MVLLLKGFARIFESDLIAVTDPKTFKILPWRPQENAVGRMFCDILNPDRTPYQGDTRYILKKNLERIKKQNYTFYLGPELEYFYFKDETRPQILDKAGILIFFH
jgi:glutamine synthetase